MLPSSRCQFTVMVNRIFASSSIRQPIIAWPPPSTGPQVFSAPDLRGVCDSARQREVQSSETGGPSASAITSFSQISSSTSRARRSASHALAAAICSSGGLASTPSLSFAAGSAAISATGGAGRTVETPPHRTHPASARQTSAQRSICRSPARHGVTRYPAPPQVRHRALRASRRGPRNLAA